MVKNLPGNAGDTGSIPGPRGSHYVATTEPKDLDPKLRNKRSHHMLQGRVALHSQQLEKALTEQQRPRAAKNRLI